MSDAMIDAAHQIMLAMSIGSVIVVVAAIAMLAIRQ
jgi:hypothetical protein